MRLWLKWDPSTDQMLTNEEERRFVVQARFLNDQMLVCKGKVVVKANCAEVVAACLILCIGFANSAVAA